MADAVFETHPKRCVELGVFGGRSLISQGFALRHLNCGVIAGVDPWRKQDALEGENPANREWWSKCDIEEIHRRAMAAIWDNNLESHVSIIRNASQHAAALFDEIDMLMIAGNHSEVASMRDVELWVPKLRKGSYIFADDANWEGPQKAYARLQEMADLVAIGTEVVDGVEVKGRYLVLRKK